MASKERVMVKRGNDYVHLVVSSKPDATFMDSQWIQNWFAIPEEYRCDPFKMSPSGDLFWADKRNVDFFNKHAAIAQQQYANGEYTECRTKEELHAYLDAL